MVVFVFYMFAPNRTELAIERRRYIYNAISNWIQLSLG